MPGIEELQQERQRLQQRLRELRQAHDRGEEFDASEFSQVEARLRALEAEIQELGGTLDLVPSTSAVTSPGGQAPVPPTQPPPHPAPPTPGVADARPASERVRDAQSRVEYLRGREPHPDVSADADGKVTGGTAEELQEQVRWREELDRAEHDLAVAQAEELWEATGGAGCFTQAARADLQRRVNEIQRLRAEDERVKEEIERLEALLGQAQGQLDGSLAGGGGPSARSGGAILAGARYQGDLRRQYEEQARIRRRIADLVREVSARVIEVVRPQLQTGGGTDRLSLPSSRAGRRSVETELLRRILRRLDFPDLGTEGDGLLSPGDARRTGSRPHRRAALIGGTGLLLLGLAMSGAFLIARSGGTEQSQPPVQDQPAAATTAPLQVGCLVLTESSLDGIDVLSGQGYQGRIRVVVRDREGVPAADAHVFIRTEKSDGTRTTAEGVTNANGYVVFGMRTTQPGTNTLFITNVEKSGCSWGVSNTSSTWEAIAPSAPPVLRLSCDHRLPGVESDVIIRGENFAPGQAVPGQVTGPGVVGNGQFNATVGADGRFEARVPINRFGTYTVTAASLSSTVNVGTTCSG